MPKKSAILLLIALSGFLSMCQREQQNILEVENVKSDKPRNLSPGTTPEDIELLVKGNSEFAWKLYKLLGAKKENVFFSPYSISQALSMAWAGARNATETEMAQAMCFYLSQQYHHPAFNALDLRLLNQEQSVDKPEEKFALSIANSVWGQKDFHFEMPFLDTLAEHYGAWMRLLDFIHDPESCRQTINQWVAEQTKDKIKDLIPPRVIDALTRLVLANAIYFKANWLSPFQEKFTSSDSFNLLDGSQTTVKMMHLEDYFPYAQGDGWQAVELPYCGKKHSMLIVLPAQGRFNEIETWLDHDRLQAIVKGLENNSVILSFPRFAFSCNASLVEYLQAMGMTSAFSLYADFSGITGRKDLYISDVIHQANIAVDEKGTEAAAATAVIIGMTYMPGERIEFKADRPFIFCIRDKETGAILFLGRLTRPQ